MGEDGKTSEVREMAEIKKKRRSIVNKAVETLWKKGSEDEGLQNMRNGKNDKRTSREEEAKLVAEKFEERRKISGDWLKKSKQDAQDAS